MTKQVEPDAWRYNSVAKTKEKKYRHKAISFKDPSQNKTQKTSRGTAGIVENKEPLFAESTITETIEETLKELEREENLPPQYCIKVFEALKEEFEQGETE
jgi:hypothetical protein